MTYVQNNTSLILSEVFQYASTNTLVYMDTNNPVLYGLKAQTE